MPATNLLLANGKRPVRRGVDASVVKVSKRDPALFSTVNGIASGINPGGFVSPANSSIKSSSS